MLKLERTAQRHLDVIVHDRERFFNTPLLTAFAIAAAIHLLLFLTFHIAPLALRVNERDFPPMIVLADPAAPSDAAVTAAAGPTPPIKDYLPPLPAANPQVAEIPSFMSVRHSDDVKQDYRSTSPFTPIERDIYAAPIAVSCPVSHKPALDVIISGPLSSSAPLATTWTALPLPALAQNDLSEHRVVFSVVADSPSGKIVWLQRKESSQNRQLDKLAEKIVLDMQFARHTGECTVDGEIELHFRNTMGGDR